MAKTNTAAAARVKVKSLKIVKIFPEKNYILVTGSVPGHNGSIVLIQK